MLFIMLLTPTAAAGEWTALHNAAAEGDAEHVKRLLNIGADVDAKLKDDRTPLHWAVSFGNAAVVKLLLEGGADVEARDKYGKTPHDLAKNQNIIRLLDRLMSQTMPSRKESKP